MLSLRKAEQAELNKIKGRFGVLFDCQKSRITVGRLSAARRIYALIQVYRRPFLMGSYLQPDFIYTA